MNEPHFRTQVGRELYPPIRPFDSRMISVGGGHHIYVEHCGAPQGVPVICLHGGPGGGCSPTMRRFFDPKVYHIILMDQRGCGKSTPTACVAENTTGDLIADIERIRKLLGIEKWILFGGSWGAALALLYAQEYPQNVVHLVLRGVFLMTRRELDWFYGGGAGKFWPEHWQRFSGIIPAQERGDLIEAYHKRLFSGDLAQEIAFARCWHEWELRLCKLNPVSQMGEVCSSYARTVARLENHYFMNAGFLRHDNQILDDMPKIASIPGNIVHGRYDVVCPPESAWLLADSWPNCKLEIVAAGHALSEPVIQERLVSIMNELRSSEL